MRHDTAVAPVAALLLAACAGPSPSASSSHAAKTIKVAGVQYAAGSHAKVSPACAGASSPDNCAVRALVDRAAAQGAALVVTPEYGLDQDLLEPDPQVGQDPCAAGSAGGALVRAFSEQARQRSLFVVINLQTYSGSGAGKQIYNSQVALGPDGTVRAVHHKFELFAGESAKLTPGQGGTVFKAPFGTVGLLICADLYGDLRLHHELTHTRGARLVVVSSYWTAPGAASWQQHFARNWGVHVVGANTTAGPGKGGGVFDPEGRTLARRSTPGLVIAPIKL